MNDAQELALRRLCERYGCDFRMSDYLVHPLDSWMTPGYAEGWVGGYGPDSIAPTIYVGVSPEGDVNS